MTGRGHGGSASLKTMDAITEGTDIRRQSRNLFATG
jgi:hypothetical protein